jgi:UDP-N-acetylglucosamine 1-carboxyvinyltransferase
MNREAATRTRSILLFIGPLLHHFRAFSIPQSGGCSFGTRTVRPHLFALEKFGVAIEALSEEFLVKHDGLHGAEVILHESSDTATENALFVAAGVGDTSTIKYASPNYQVQEVCGFLRALGIKVEGLGTTTLTVTGLAELPKKDVEYTVAEDPTDAMFFIASAIVTNSALTIEAAPIEFLEIELFLLEKMGLHYTLKNPRVSENGITKLVDIEISPSELTAFPEKIHPRPYPGLNMDNLPFFAVIATQARGTTLIHDWVYEKRAIYYTELDRLGAKLTLHLSEVISFEVQSLLYFSYVV